MMPKNAFESKNADDARERVNDDAIVSHRLLDRADEVPKKVSGTSLK
jgi:hypothetical protein